MRDSLLSPFAVIATASLLSAACQASSVSTATDDDELSILASARSGSRLKAEYTVAAGGLRHFERFYDSALDQYCQFRTTVRGTIECGPMPFESRFDRQFGEASSPLILYLDENCTQPFTEFYAEWRRPGEDFPTHIFGEVPLEANVCSERMTSAVDYYSRGDAPIAFAPVRYQYDPFRGTCDRDDVSESEDYEKMWIPYAITRTPPGTYVEADLALRPIGGYRLFESYLRGRDGSVAPEPFSPTIYDRVLKTFVVPAQSRIEAGSPEDEVFWPGSLGHEQSGTFADASCTQRSAASRNFASCEPQPSAVVQGVDNFDASCVNRPAYYTEGTRIDSIYYADEDSCSETALNEAGRRDWYTLGATADLSPFLAGAIRQRGHGRLATLEARNSDGSVVPMGIYDTVAKARCEFATAEDGAWVCEPETSSAEVLFADAACTQPVVAVYDSCETSALMATEDGGYERLEFGNAVETDGLELYVDWGDGCETDPNDTLRYAKGFFEVTSRSPLSAAAGRRVLR